MELPVISLVVGKANSNQVLMTTIFVTQVVAANRVPLVDVMPGTLEMLDKMQGIW